MAENLVTVAASLGISSITCLIFWFCSMFPGALEGKRILAVRHDKWQPGEKKKHSVYASHWCYGHSWTMMLQSGVETARMCLSSVYHALVDFSFFFLFLYSLLFFRNTFLLFALWMLILEEYPSAELFSSIGIVWAASRLLLLVMCCQLHIIWLLACANCIFPSGLT